MAVHPSDSKSINQSQHVTNSLWALPWILWINVQILSKIAIRTEGITWLLMMFQTYGCVWKCWWSLMTQYDIYDYLWHFMILYDHFDGKVMINHRMLLKPSALHSASGPRQSCANSFCFSNVQGCFDGNLSQNLAQFPSIFFPGSWCVNVAMEKWPVSRLVGGDWNMTFMTFHIYWESSSQLIVIFFQRGWNHQPEMIDCFWWLEIAWNSYFELPQGKTLQA